MSYDTREASFTFDLVHLTEIMKSKCDNAHAVAVSLFRLYNVKEGTR